MAFSKLGQPIHSSTNTSSKRRPLVLFLLILISFPLLFLSIAFFPNPQLVDVVHLQTQYRPQASIFLPNKVKPPKWLKVILETHLTPNKTLQVGLINFDHTEWSHLKLGGNAEFVTINFKSISSNVTWENLFPEWIDETNPKGWCPNIPMPEQGKFFGLDVVVAQLPCKEAKERDDIEGNGKRGKAGIRDVHRLQISLASAHLVVENGINNQEKDVYAVFMSKCEPMLEMFRCDDLLWHRGEYWVYKPNVEKLKEMIRLPVGSCALAHPYTKNLGSRQWQASAANQSPHEQKILTRSQSTSTQREAYVTVLHSTEDYVCGAIALAQSILQTNTSKDLMLLADHTITHHSILGLQAAGWKIKRIERIKSPNAKSNAYNKWNYSKLRIWQLIEYDKLIFIDSDFVVLRNIDHFFDNPQLSAAPNDKWLFNSGIMVLEPSKCFFDNLMSKRYTFKSYNGGDQGYLNEVVTWWHRLTLKLNYMKFFDKEGRERLVPNDRYTIHFLGTKPWLCYRDYDCNWDRQDYHLYASDHAHAKWWQVYDTMPMKLQKYCGMTRRQDRGVRIRKSRARKANLSDKHWKIELKDPRQHHLVESL